MLVASFLLCEDTDHEFGEVVKEHELCQLWLDVKIPFKELSVWGIAKSDDDKLV